MLVTRKQGAEGLLGFSDMLRCFLNMSYIPWSQLSYRLHSTSSELVRKNVWY